MIVVTGVTLNLSACEEAIYIFSTKRPKGVKNMQGCSEDFAVVDGNEVNRCMCCLEV